MGMQDRSCNLLLGVFHRRGRNIPTGLDEDILFCSFCVENIIKGLLVDRAGLRDSDVEGAVRGDKRVLTC